MGSMGSQDPSLALVDQDHIVGGMFEGMSVSADRGCNWTLAPELAGKPFVDVAVRKNAPGSALGLSSAYGGENDAGIVWDTQIFSTSNGGATWTAYGTKIPDDARVETLDVSATDPHRVYLSAVRGTGATSKSVLFVSIDDGANWIERAIPTDANTERAPFVAAVDPANADRVYVRTDSDAGSRLLVTDDAGVSFREAWKGTGKMLGFAVSPDGAKVFLGGPDDGLLSAGRDLAFAKKSSIHVQCLATEGATLFACSDEVSGFTVGKSEDDGATFSPSLHIYGIRGPLSCSATASESVCVDQWPSLRDALAQKSPDAGDDAGAPPPDASTTTFTAGGGGCRESNAPLGVGALLAAASLVALVGRRRRR
jgi:hypothetical protein